MRSYIILSLFIATACAASLGHKDDLTVSTPSTTTTTTEASVTPKALNGVKKEDSKTLVESSKNVVKSDATTKTEESAANHVHTREINEHIGAGSQLIQNGGLFGSNNGFGNGGIVRTERTFSTGGLANNGGILSTGSIVGNGAYNQGLSGTAGILNSGKLVNSGGLISSGQVLNSGRIIETTGNQIYQSGGTIGAGQIGSGRVIKTGQILGTGSNGVLLNSNNNYQSGSIGIGGQTLQNSAQGSNRQYVVGLNELNSVPQTVEYSKQFYHFEAPEEHHESGQISKQLSNVLKKNLQVVFINAPENTATTNAALQLAKQAIEQRTAIYVLSKETEAARLVGQLEQIQENVQTKPEVRIIKYRTPEDLERAKLEIQSQYEATGGSTESFNGGIVPVLNYASDAKDYNGVQTLLGQGIVSHLGGGHHADSSNVVSTKEAFLGSSVGQLNVIKSSNIAPTVSPIVYNSNSVGSGSSLIGSNTERVGLIGSGSLQGATISPSSQYQSSGSTKFFGTGGPLISQSNSIPTFNTNSVLTPISKIPVSGNVALKTSENINSGNSFLVDSYNVGKGDGFGSSSLQTSQSGLSSGSLIGSGSGISNVIVSGSSKPIGTGLVGGGNIGSVKQTGGSVTFGSGSGFSNNVQSGSQTGLNVGTSKVVSGGSGLTNIAGSGSLQGSNTGSKFITGTDSSNNVGSQSTLGFNNLGSGSLQTSNTGSQSAINSFGTGSSNIVGSGSSLGSNSGIKSPITSFGTGSSNTVGSGSSLGSNTLGSSSLQGSNTGSKTYVTSLGTGSSNNVGTGSSLGSNTSGSTSLQGSNTGSKSSTTSFGNGSTSNVGSGSLLGSGSVSKTVGSNLSNTLGSGSVTGYNTGTQSSANAFGTGSSKTPTAATGSPVKSGAGSYASQLTIDSSKLSTPGSLSITGSGSTLGSSTKIIDGVSVLSSTDIDHGLNGSKGSKNLKSSGTSGYESGLGIGSSIGELVKKNEYQSSASEKVLSSIDVTNPIVNRQYLPPSNQKKN